MEEHRRFQGLPPADADPPTSSSAANDPATVRNLIVRCYVAGPRIGTPGPIGSARVRGPRHSPEREPLRLRFEDPHAIGLQRFRILRGRAACSRSGGGHRVVTVCPNPASASYLTPHG